MKEKRYIVRKYVMAKSVADAVLKERKSNVEDCWLDEEWKKLNDSDIAKPIGYKSKKNKSK